jgi:hypothetical protein
MSFNPTMCLIRSGPMQPPPVPPGLRFALKVQGLAIQHALGEIAKLYTQDDDAIREDEWGEVLIDAATKAIGAQVQWMMTGATVAQARQLEKNGTTLEQANAYLRSTESASIDNLIKDPRLGEIAEIMTT